MRPLPASIVIQRGHHDTCPDGGCVMDWVSYVCELPITDEPECASPVLRNYAIVMNDAMPDDETRTRLLTPLIGRLAGSVSTAEVEQRRAYFLADRAVRFFAPLALDSAGLRSDAAILRALSEITDMSTAEAAWTAAGLAAATEAARAVASAADRDAARDAAGAAATEAVRAAEAVGSWSEAVAVLSAATEIV